MRGQAFVAATAMVAALMGAVQPAAAQHYPSYHDAHVANQQQCQQSRQNRMIGGAIIGGIAGALLGREVADRGVRGEGAALGAAVGAAAGAGIGRSTARCATVPQGDYDPYYGRSYQYHREDPYRSDDSGLYGGPYEDPRYERDYRY